MGIRNCAEIGENLQKIVARLMANDNLIKLLYYADKDPLSQPTLSDVDKKSKIYNNLIRVLPNVTNKDTAQSIIVIKVTNGISIKANTEFKIVHIDIDVLVPLTSWFIKSTNLRPFYILGEIQNSLNGKTINGLGKMTGGDFELSFLTEELSCYEAHYEITSYD